MARTAGLYARISDDRSGARAGVNRQQDDCRALAERLGWRVADTYVDNDQSAYSGRRRAEYERLLADLKEGVIDAIVAWHPDRLTRHMAELERLILAVDAAGAEIATVLAGTYDLSNASGRMTARIIGTTARYESELKSERTVRKHRELAEAGKPVGGTRPFGYEDDKVTIRPSEAALILDAAGRVLAGETVRSICMDWTARGVPGTRSGRMTQTALRRILTSPRTAGLRSLGRDGPVVAQGQWPAILDEVTWRRVRAVIDSRRTEGYGSARRYLLTGFLVCGRDGCAVKLIARPTSARRRTYVCASNPDKGGCGGIRIVAEPLEEEVTARVFAAADAAELARLAADHAGDGDGELLAAIARDEAELEQLARDHYVDRLIDRAEFFAARRGLQAGLEDLRRRLGEHQRREALVLPGSMSEAWPSWTLDQQRAALSVLVDRIVIHAAVHSRGKFDPDRVEVVWRT